MNNAVESEYNLNLDMFFIPGKLYEIHTDIEYLFVTIPTIALLIVFILFILRQYSTFKSFKAGNIKKRDFITEMFFSIFIIIMVTVVVLANYSNEIKKIEIIDKDTAKISYMTLSSQTIYKKDFRNWYFEIYDQEKRINGSLHTYNHCSGGLNSRSGQQESINFSYSDRSGIGKTLCHEFLINNQFFRDKEAMLKKKEKEKNN